MKQFCLVAIDIDMITIYFLIDDSLLELKSKIPNEQDRKRDEILLRKFYLIPSDPYVSIGMREK